MAKYTLGESVRFSRQMLRTTTREVNEHGYAKYRRGWEPSAWFYKEPREGVVVGTRTLYTGIFQRGSYEEPSFLSTDGSIQAVLVAWNIRKAPVYVSPDDIERMDPVD
jgi:hypothetical protein